MVVGALVMALSISCSNEGTTGGDTGGNSGNGGTEIGGNSGGDSSGGGSGSGEAGETEILTPEEGTYDIDYPEEVAYFDITIIVKTNEDSTVQISGNSSYIVYNKDDTYSASSQDFNCKTSSWAKESGTDYKISKSIISEAVSNYGATPIDNAEAKWRYFYSNEKVIFGGITTNKYIELDFNYSNIYGGQPYRAVALKKATR